METTRRALLAQGIGAWRAQRSRGGVSLCHGVIHVPSDRAVEVERQWTQLMTRIAQARLVPPAPIAAVVTK